MKKAIAGAVAGAVVGAVVVGGIWFFTSADKTVATVNGVKLYEKDFNTKLAQAQGKDVLKKMIDDQIITSEAAKLKITNTDAEVKKELDGLVKDKFGGDQSKFEQALKDYNIKLDDLKHDIATNLLAKKIATKDVKVTDDEIKKYYDQNKQVLGTQEQVHARHILVKDKAKADKLFAELQAHPEEFEKLAKDNSEDPSNKDKGGDLGTFGKGTMVKEFEDAAFKAKANTIVGPVKTEFGYHIIQVLEHKDATVPTFDKVKDQITETLKEQKAVPMNTLLTDLEKKANVVIDRPEFKDVLKPPADPSADQSGQQQQQAPANGGQTPPPATK
ncbi:MAG: peptidylprolyl isomerase [Tumebacillaceae bacterium]